MEFLSKLSTNKLYFPEISLLVDKRRVKQLCSSQVAICQACSKIRSIATKPPEWNNRNNRKEIKSNSDKEESVLTRPFFKPHIQRAQRGYVKSLHVKQTLHPCSILIQFSIGANLGKHQTRQQVNFSLTVSSWSVLGQFSFSSVGKGGKYKSRGRKKSGGRGGRSDTFTRYEREVQIMAIERQYESFIFSYTLKMKNQC